MDHVQRLQLTSTTDWVSMPTGNTHLSISCEVVYNTDLGYLHVGVVGVGDVGTYID